MTQAIPQAAMVHRSAANRADAVVVVVVVDGNRLQLMQRRSSFRVASMIFPTSTKTSRASLMVWIAMKKRVHSLAHHRAKAVVAAISVAAVLVAVVVVAIAAALVVPMRLLRVCRLLLQLLAMTLLKISRKAKAAVAVVAAVVVVVAVAVDAIVRKSKALWVKARVRARVMHRRRTMMVRALIKVDSKVDSKASASRAWSRADDSSRQRRGSRAKRFACMPSPKKSNCRARTSLRSAPNLRSK